MLNTSGWAFSISSKRTTEYGFLLTLSLSCPPSSYPTYPGGEPISFDTLCFSIYSDISTRIIASSEPKTASANVFESSVFPTPVGPKNRNEPIGLLALFSPTLPLRTAFATAVTASVWPTTRLCNIDSNFNNLCCSFFPIFVTGIPVHIDTISSIVFSSITGLYSFSVPCHFAIALSRAVCALSKSFLRTAAPLKSPCLTHISSSRFNSATSSSLFVTDFGFGFSLILTFEHASSIKSIALSGRFLSLIYLVESFTAASTASSEILTLWNSS